jgi:LacI family transcriptional regulator
MKNTLIDVARRAGVSTITASRALGGSGLVAEATRKRILTAATELGYVPNLIARGLVQKRTSVVGVLLRELANPFFAPMLRGIENVAERRGYLVVVGESGLDEQREAYYVDRFRQLRLGGMIVTPASSRVQHLSVARSAGTPVVVMARRWEEGDYVTGDNLEGGRLVARHLLSRGHRLIGLLRPDEPDNTAIQDRTNGFKEVLTAASVLVPPQWDFLTASTMIADGAEAADRIREFAQRPTAIFVATDRQALGLIRRLRAHGVRVPEDLAVVGYDDIPYADCGQVPLTSVAVPVERIGELSAEVLFDRMRDPDAREFRQLLLPPQLVVRESSP